MFNFDVSAEDGTLEQSTREAAYTYVYSSVLPFAYRSMADGTHMYIRTYVRAYKLQTQGFSLCTYMCVCDFYNTPVSTACMFSETTLIQHSVWLESMSD